MRPAYSQTGDTANHMVFEGGGTVNESGQSRIIENNTNVSPLLVSGAVGGA